MGWGGAGLVLTCPGSSGGRPVFSRGPWLCLDSSPGFNTLGVPHYDQRLLAALFNLSGEKAPCRNRPFSALLAQYRPHSCLIIRYVTIIRYVSSHAAGGVCPV